MIILPTIDPRLYQFSRIALYGPMCVGKTFLAKKLQPYGWAKLSFADRIKDLSRELFQIEGKDGESRKFYQDFGSALRNFDSNVWINVVLQEVAREPYHNFVIDDLRLISEANALREAGFLLIRVDANEKIRQNRIKALYPNTLSESHLHSSELEWKNIAPDYAVYSNNESDWLDFKGWMLWDIE